jgi:hypothetical protein
MEHSWVTTNGNSCKLRFDRGPIVDDIILLPPKAFGAGRQSSSGVEQRTHKPLVGGSNPSSGTINLLGKTHKMPVFTGVLCTYAEMAIGYLREGSDKESERNLANLANLLANRTGPIFCSRDAMDTKQIWQIPCQDRPKNGN